MTFDDIKYMALTIWGEARGEDMKGQLAVAHVILNRARKRMMTPQQVCLAPFQFSCWNKGDPNYLLLNDPHFDCTKVSFWDALNNVQVVTRSSKDDFTNGATHYCTKNIEPYWAKDKTPCFEWGNHKFYNNID